MICLMCAADTGGGAAGNQGGETSDTGGETGGRSEFAVAAEARAHEIGAKFPWYFKPEATFAVAFMQDSMGNVETFVALNEGALEKWAPRIEPYLEPEENWVLGDITGKRHAEVLLVNYANASNLTIVGIGSSNKSLSSMHNNA